MKRINFFLVVLMFLACALPALAMNDVPAPVMTDRGAMFTEDALRAGGLDPDDTTNPIICPHDDWMRSSEGWTEVVASQFPMTKIDDGKYVCTGSVINRRFHPYQKGHGCAGGWFCIQTAYPDAFWKHDTTFLEWNSSGQVAFKIKN